MASDIDFDELDRAVSSILGGDGNDSKPADNNSDTSVSVNSNPSESPKPTPVVVPANRRGNGRFMDIRPTNKPVAVNSTPVSPAMPVSQPPVPAVVPASAPADTSTSTDWPDPIDFMNNKDSSSNDEVSTTTTDTPPATDAPSNSDTPTADEAPKAEDQPVEEPAPAEVDDVDPGELAAPVEPPTTPFLPDAKVEKRPLGSFATPLNSGSNSDELMDHHDEVKLDAPTDLSSEPTPVADSTEPADTPATTANDNLSTPPEVPSNPVVDSDTPMPAELQEDVLSLESDEVKAPVVSAPASATSSTSVSANVEAGPASIVQQYKEKQSTETPASGAIYDTEAYHKPLTPKKKSSKKHGWLVALWVFLLIVLGAGVGAAIYYFILPLLG